MIWSVDKWNAYYCIKCYHDLSLSLGCTLRTLNIDYSHTKVMFRHEPVNLCEAVVTGMEWSEHCSLTDHPLRARVEGVCGVYLAYSPLALLPTGLTLPPLDLCPLALTLSAAPLFHFPPNNSMTNWGCQKTIYHCPTSHPPLPSVASFSLSRCLTFPLRSCYRAVLF